MSRNSSVDENKNDNYSFFKYIKGELFTFQAIQLLLMTVATIGVGASLLSMLFSQAISENYIERAPIENAMFVAVNNGASLPEIRHLFEKEKKPIASQVVMDAFFPFSNARRAPKEYFKEATLSYVLSDLIASEYTKKDINIDYIGKLRKLLSDHEMQNPFDKLEIGQRQYFENIEAKVSAEVYRKIQPDINKLVDQLDTKNRLVSEYLGDSTFSLRVSLGALGFSFLFGFYQLYLGRKKRTKETILEALQSHNHS